ncbi:MAG: squalene--hopene cyclase [Bryobacteraceae bacterium]|nr:squalene--hopene cyclase [Bryobacteraceae bacterium]
MNAGVQVADPVLSGALEAIRKASEYLIRRQHRTGYWWFDLTADATLESDWILMQLWLHPPDANGAWNPPNGERIQRAAASILARQLGDGGFAIYPGGPADVSASIKAYTALKLAGAKEDRLSPLRERILALGGLQAANSYVKINLSLFGLFPREHTPSVPPEMIFAGKFLYEMSSWTRAIVIPLAIVHSLNPMRPVPAGFSLQELVTAPGSFAFVNDHGLFSWRNFFLKLDGVLKRWERMGPASLRRNAISRCKDWILARTRYTDGLAAIYPPMMYTIMALDLLGLDAAHEDLAEAQRQFDALLVDDERGFYIQPCFSVVWDTATIGFALGEAGGLQADAAARAAGWLLTKEVRRKGDWSIKRPNLEPSGWYFEFANDYYPDIDDTAMVLLALSNWKAADAAAQAATEKRAVNWLLGMQSKNGGWAAFDVDNDSHALSWVPFADHNAMLDPACPDITGRVVEALCRMGCAQASPAIRRAVKFLETSQTSEGNWSGRWGVNYIYGTCFALRGLAAAGESDREAYILRAGEWLRSIQNADGGWGESCESYARETFVPAASTPSQTAWAILGLLASGDTTSISVQKGVEYLIATQREDGDWAEAAATGTGFPNVFYLSYHQYRVSYPLLALAEFRKIRAGAAS